MPTEDLEPLSGVSDGGTIGLKFFLTLLEQEQTARLDCRWQIAATAWRVDDAYISGSRAFTKIYQAWSGDKLIEQGQADAPYSLVEALSRKIVTCATTAQRVMIEATGQ